MSRLTKRDLAELMRAKRIVRIDNVLTSTAAPKRKSTNTPFEGGDDLEHVGGYRYIWRPKA